MVRCGRFDGIAGWRPVHLTASRSVQVLHATPTGRPQSVVRGRQGLLATRRQRVPVRHEALQRASAAGLHAMAVVLEINAARMAKDRGSLAPRKRRRRRRLRRRSGAARRRWAVGASDRQQRILASRREARGILLQATHCRRSSCRHTCAMCLEVRPTVLLNRVLLRRGRVLRRQRARQGNEHQGCPCRHAKPRSTQ
jgi:hypothetical protein